MNEISDLPSFVQIEPVGQCNLRCRMCPIQFRSDGAPGDCCMVATPDHMHFGDMKECGVAQVWNNEAYRRFREQLASVMPPEVCRSCAIYAGTF
jgi:hypothetical protein